MVIIVLKELKQSGQRHVAEQNRAPPMMDLAGGNIEAYACGHHARHPACSNLSCVDALLNGCFLAGGEGILDKEYIGI